MDLSSAESEEYQAEVQVQEKADADFLKSGRGRGADFSCRITVAVPNKRKRFTRLVDRVIPLPGLRSFRGEDTVSILYTLTNPDGSLVRKAVCLLPADPAIVDAAFEKLQARGPGVTTLGRGQNGKEGLQKVTSLDCGQYEYDPELGSCVLGQMYVEADEIITWTSDGLENLTYYPPNEDEAGGGGGDYVEPLRNCQPNDEECGWGNLLRILRRALKAVDSGKDLKKLSTWKELLKEEWDTIAGCAGNLAESLTGAGVHALIGCAMDIAIGVKSDQILDGLRFIGGASILKHLKGTGIFNYFINTSTDAASLRYLADLDYVQKSGWRQVDWRSVSSSEYMDRMLQNGWRRTGNDAGTITDGLGNYLTRYIPSSPDYDFTIQFRNGTDIYKLRTSN